MYYPYLYGKQKELLAVRELTSLLATDGVVRPVIEPVRANTTLPLTLVECEKASAETFIVVNPNALDFSSSTVAASYQWGKALFADLTQRLKGVPDFLFPTLLVTNQSSVAQIAQFRKDYASFTVGYVLRSPSISANDLAKAIGTMKPEGRIFLHGDSPLPATTNALQKNRCVWVENLFPYKSRNADYSVGSFFSDRHVTFKAGGYGGFSDYAVFRPTASEGGGRPGAVAFHMTHKEHSSGALHVEHFVSDRTDQKDNDDAGKFMEALAKFRRATRRSSSSFGLTSAADEYLERFRTSNPPSLGTSKQLQVAHHLELVSGLLSNRF